MACLASLNRQRLDDNELTVHLTVDGCVDGTRELVERSFPDVQIHPTVGDAFWAGGMRVALRAAAEGQPDVYVWLNDDVVLEEDALSRLLKPLQDSALNGVLVGSVRDPSTNRVTYGGFRSVSRWRPLTLSRVEPGESWIPVDAGNGNLVAVASRTAFTLGLFPARYRHGMADLAYSFEAKAKGISVWLAPGTFGTCSANSIEHSWRDPMLPRVKRMAMLARPTGLPMGDWLRLTRKYGGLFWPLIFASPYVKVAIGR